MIYEDCTLCPNLCHEERTKGRGACGQSDKVMIAWSGLHKGEEPPVSGRHGSGMIFFTGCPLGCRYCQNWQISSSDADAWGIEVSTEELANLMLRLQEMKAATLNLVTGTHFIPSIVQALEEAGKMGFRLPVVWNSSRQARISIPSSEMSIFFDDAIPLTRISRSNSLRSLSLSLAS